MDTTITWEQLGCAMERPVLIASAVSSKSKRSKLMHFIPSELKYRIILTEENSKTSTSTKHPQDALEAYNAIII